MPHPLTCDLLHWYDHHRRDLPWRDRSDPYAIWVSEIMLQQTRAETVIPYFQRWLERFPTVFDLAAADLQEVLSLWEGLGYYSRARNLHRAATIVVDTLQGQLPESAKALQQLPGIGTYTAGAIASIGFGQNEPALDGNGRRVLARWFDVAEPVNQPKGDRRLQALAREYLPPGRAGDFNQAVMDLGATLCTPRQPNCAACPVRSHCCAYRLGNQAERPILPPRPRVPHHTAVAAAIVRQQRVLLAQRQERGLLGGMWEFPNTQVTHIQATQKEGLARVVPDAIQQCCQLQVEVEQAIGVFRHAYTHFKVTLHAYRCALLTERSDLQQAPSQKWVALSELPDYPMGKLSRQVARALVAQH